MNILIVDDEEIILHGIKRLVEGWDDFNIIGIADDGATALEWLKKAEVLPDLVITDILMRYVDGLEFIEQSSRLYPEIKYVILSGHEEFHLAQKAIDLHVLRYITKPINPSELRAVLQHIWEELKKERETRTDLLKKEKLATDGVLYIRDKLLSDLLEGRVVSRDDLQDFVDCFPFSFDESFTAGVVRLVNAGVSIGQREMLLNGIGVKQLFLETYLLQCEGFIIFKDLRTLVFGVQAQNKEDLKKLCRLADNVLGVQIDIEFDNNVMGLFHLQETVERLIERLESRKAESFDYPLEQEQQLRLALRLGRKSEMDTAKADFIANLIVNNSSIESVLQGFYKMIESVSDLFKEMEITCPNLPPLSNIPLSIIIERVEKWLNTCMQERERFVSTHNVDSIEIIIRYINEYYGDSSLTLKKLANVVSLHPNHLTQLFRKYKGLSCMQYLAQVRMEKAKELLHKSDLKIAMIAKQVGYENPLYFSTYFKKWVGVNPSDYKERLQQDD